MFLAVSCTLVSVYTESDCDLYFLCCTVNSHQSVVFISSLESQGGRRVEMKGADVGPYRG